MIAKTEETPVRLPTHIREDAFFMDLKNRTVLTGGLQMGVLQLPTEGYATDRLYWTSLLITGVTLFFIVTQLHLWMVSLTLGVIAILGVTFLNKRILSQQVTQRFREEGYILRGEIISCVAFTDTWLPTDSANFNIKVEYRFTTPHGDTLQPTIEQVRNDLNGKPLPLPETPLYILYFNDREYHLL